MALVVFADESGIHADSPCYGIGAFIVPQTELSAFEHKSDLLAVKHGIVRELKWKRISKSHGELNFVMDMVRYLFATSSRFCCMVVNKSLYNKWRNKPERESAFYTTYSLLLADLAKLDAQLEVTIDDRQDSYAHHTEVVHKVSNYMASAANRAGTITRVTKDDSRLVRGIQVADLLTGVVVAGHQRFLRASSPMNRGKEVLQRRIAQMLGWDRLCYDTFPCTDLNIWHFPKQWTGVPGSRRVVLHSSVPYVDSVELER